MNKQEEILEDFESYLWESGRIGSRATLNSYLGNVRQILVWLKKKEKRIEDLDRLVMLDYLAYLRDQNYQATTYNTKLNSLASFNSYLQTRGLVEKDLIFSKDRIRLAGSKEVEIYSEEELDLIEAYLEREDLGQRDRLILRLLKDLGLRVTELTNLKLDKIDLLALEIEVEGKGQKTRVLPIKASLGEEIQSYLRGERKVNKHRASPYLLLSERAGKLHRNTVLDISKKMGEELGIEAYNHKFRHTLATRMVRKGNINLKVVQELLGHSSIDTVFEYYVASNQEELRQALEDI